MTELEGPRPIALPVQSERRHRKSQFADFFGRLLREKPLGTLGLAIVLILLVCGVFAGVLAPYDVSKINLENMLQPPTVQHWLGTDQLGRDVLSRILYGARVSVIIGIAATSLNILVAGVIGIFCGFFGGKLDIIAQRFVDAWMAFPGLLLLITIMSLVGQGTLQIILVLGISGGIGASRILRGAVIGIRENTYMTAEKAIGTTTPRMLAKHIIPNIMAPVIIIFTTTIGGVILAEASLSFLGFGLPPDVASWGGMLSGEGRKYMEMSPGLALWPGLALSVVVYGVNMFGDALRDLLDPRLRGGAGGMGSHGSGLARRALKRRKTRKA